MSLSPDLLDALRRYDSPTIANALEAFARKHGGGLVTWPEFEARARPRLLTKVWDVLLRAHALGEVE